MYTQPPQKSNRGQKVNKSPIQLLSETLNIEKSEKKSSDIKETKDNYKNKED